MIDIRKPVQKPIVVIRAASGYELSNYEKRKLANIEEAAQVNKIEVIKINDKRVPIDPVNKEAQIELGGLAFQDKIGPELMSTKELFFIECDLEG